MNKINKIRIKNVDYDITTTLVINITYNELKTLRDESKLESGKSYRITDYVTTVAGLDLVKSANHPFDIIVTAISSNELSEDAKAVLHEGDEYFAKCQLSAWELKYCLDNDTNRFTWADIENGKGVVWYMKDESDNSAYYDFKGVQVRESKTSNDWYYTFSVYYTDIQEDFSVAKYNYNGKGCVNNTIDSQSVSADYSKATINNNAFISDARVEGEEFNIENYYWRCVDNYIGKNCTSIKINKASTCNKFGDNCAKINFDYGSNLIFGNQNLSIQFKNSDDTTFEPFVGHLQFVDADGNYIDIASSKIETNYNSAGGNRITVKCLKGGIKNLHIKRGVAINKKETIEIDECGNYTTTIERSAVTGEVIISKSGEQTVKGDYFLGTDHGSNGANMVIGSGLYVHTYNEDYTLRLKLDPNYFGFDENGFLTGTDIRISTDNSSNVACVKVLKLGKGLSLNDSNEIESSLSVYELNKPDDTVKLSSLIIGTGLELNGNAIKVSTDLVGASSNNNSIFKLSNFLFDVDKDGNIVGTLMVSTGLMVSHGNEIMINPDKISGMTFSGSTPTINLSDDFYINEQGKICLTTDIKTKLDNIN